MTTETSRPTSVFELDIPTIDVTLDHEEIVAFTRTAAKNHWLVRNPMGFSILHYDDVVASLRDKRWHSAVAKIPEMRGITDQEFLERDRESILATEGEAHTRLRRLVGKSFSPRAADRLRPFMREVINDLVDSVAAGGKADIAIDICEPYPIPIICELLGAPKNDWQLFSRWAEAILSIFNDDAIERLDTIKQAQSELDEYTRSLIADRRNDPREDLITSLIAAEEEGDRLSTDELVMMVNAVIIAGTDTTRNQLGCAVGLFAEHPDQWALLAEQPELAPQAVEEVMRYFGAVRNTVRFASEDIVYRNIFFPKGTLIMPSMVMANRDPSVFSDPGTFDITREPAGQPQLTFGSGIHYCIGAALARAELQEAQVILTQRMPKPAVDDAIE
ncbi:MAG: cytochrome P450 [Actinobacteria bacterium]|nr:MAG: cytochrome P450 [Actinomycetota bacterium]